MRSIIAASAWQIVPPARFHPRCFGSPRIPTLTGLAAAAVLLVGCGGGGSDGGSLPGGSGGGPTISRTEGTAQFHVDVPTGQVTVTPLGGSRKAGRAVFTGSTVSFTSSTLV